VQPNISFQSLKSSAEGVKGKVANQNNEKIKWYSPVVFSRGDAEFGSALETHICLSPRRLFAQNIQEPDK
jgi:hypothetical protein